VVEIAGGGSQAAFPFNLINSKGRSQGGLLFRKEYVGAGKKK